MQKMQRGVTLIELILVVGLMSAMTMLTFFEKQYDLEQAKARSIGGQLFQYNNAVRSALAKNPPTVSSTYSGSAWLKSSACGGMLSPGEEYLPCDFPLATGTNPIPFGNLALTTVVAVTGAAAERAVTATTSTSPFSVAENGLLKVRSDLAGIAVLSAASAVGTGVQSLSGGVSPVAATTDSRFNSDPLTGVMTFVSSNTAANDIWLRTDGSNSMHSSMVFDSADPYNRQILGASLVQNIAGQALFLGSGSGLSAVTSAGVVIDSGAEVLGAFRIRDSLTVDGTAKVAGKLTVSSDIAAGGSITTAGNLVVGGATSSQVYYDANDSTYYVDPNGSSNLNAVAANYVGSNGRVRAGEYLEVAGVAAEGSGCAPAGLIGRDAYGGLLSCKDGVWSAPGISVAAPETIVSLGPTRGIWSGCWTTVRPALITASGPGATVLTVNGATISSTMGWGGEFSDIGMDFAISGLVPAGGTYCYYVTNNRKYSTSSGIRVISSTL